ncbi:MAG: ATP-dependent DNA helicase RecG [Candidatus Borkfalkiaceae bacterium]|nr:ATP-dependent DNA helicase RecG [Christensenellaceae bacterium]
MLLKYVKGLSDKRIEDLNEMGIFSAEDLIKHFPRNYLDLTSVLPLKTYNAGEYAFTKARLISSPQTFTSARKLKCVKALCSQGNEVFTVMWFNQPYVTKRLECGEEYLFYGRLQCKYDRFTMTNPTFEKAEKNDYLKGILPVYTLRGSIYQRAMQKIILDAVYKVKPVSLIPAPLIKKYDLAPLEEAYLEVHSPSSFENKDRASDRIAIEEYFALVTAFKVIKGDKQQMRGVKYTATAENVKEFVLRFGFEFTEGQKKAVNEIFSDMRAPTVMNRLLQGDVGCGKTAVALCSMFIALKSGFQAAFVSPTEVLAEQNYELAKKYLGEFKVALLKGSMTAAEKNAVKKGIKSGEIQLVAGTHAVFQKDVEFNALSLCVCDEQHRFGVAQRSSLLAKGTAPDLLVMSATPIPRTLSLIFYGDLDITTIADKPKARASIGTNIVPPEKYDGMIKFIRGEIDKGRRVYFVAPKIEDDEEGEIISVTELHERLTKELAGVKVSLLHGKMKDKEKAEIMDDFKNGDCRALVSTTVIEVGVDVKDATVMVIFGADRFGLSQLHQLRGRVGRSDLKSYCFLLANTDNPDTIERLKTLCGTNDGFKIAEADFKMRGSGDFLGVRQSGRATSELGSLKYGTEAIFLAKRLADEAVTSGFSTATMQALAVAKYKKLSEVSLN